MVAAFFRIKDNTQIMKKRFLTLAAAMLIMGSALAVPAKRSKIKVPQPDGTMLTVMTVGDENFHFTSTEDMLPVVRRADGAYCYARLDTDGSIVATAQVAHDKAMRPASEQSFLLGYATEAGNVRKYGARRASERNGARVARLMKRRSTSTVGGAMKSSWAGAGGGEGVGVTGKRKGLVILVNFKDKKMLAANSREEWNKFFNEQGYSKNGNSGSVHDYFTAQSYGQFDLEFDVVGPVTVSKNMAAYGANDSKNNDVDPGGMVYEACKLADPEVNFADYDWDGDGEVDQVYLIYAGYGESSGDEDNPLTNTIWPHEWNLSSQRYSLRLDGVKIDTYGCSSELNGNTGSLMDGIGTACHEFSHCLGIPDLYDTEYSGGFGMGSWDLMDYGSYGGDGYKPVGYNTYERWVSGWMQPTELKEPCYVTDLKPLSDSPESYIIYNEKTPTEYYILENRQLKGTDASLPASGMLVIHVDYDKQIWDNNTINNVKSHQRFSIVAADNKWTSDTEDGDTYPGKTGNTALTDTSTPAATLFNANADNRKFLGKPITSIAESADGLISFTFMNGIELNTPDGLASSDVADNSFIASWTAAENAETYTLQLREKGNQPSAEESLVMAEDFTTWGASLKMDGNIDISAKLDEYTKNQGWTGAKIYECPGMMKIGSSKTVGRLVSPLVSAHASQSVTVALLSKPYGSDAAETTVSLLDANENEISSATLVPDGSLAAVVLPNTEEKDFKVQIKPKKRSYVYSVGLYDGAFTTDDFDDSSSSKPHAVLAKAASVTEIPGVTSTSYRFENLTPSGKYLWRVRAVAGDVLSPWSGWQTVELGTAGISQLFKYKTGDVVEVRSVSGLSFGKMTYSEFMSSPQYRGTFILVMNGNALTVVK